ncbi:MAG: MBL fold metallo-hydrolase [Hyphomicrobiaceae bacterium]
MSLRLTILGCGSSGGVPRVGNDWGACDASNPKNRRQRCAALIQYWNGERSTDLLVDTGPDIRAQMLAVKLRKVDAVLYTHEHADHAHGIDDLRFLAYRMRSKIDVWADVRTRQSLINRFGYCFAGGGQKDYPPILRANSITGGKSFVIVGDAGPVEVIPIPQAHGAIPSLGFRVGGIAYSPDISGLPDESIPLLEGLDVWIVDALRYQPHPSHFSVREACEWIARLKPRKAILTHLNVELDYDALNNELPDHIEPAYDGLVVETP